MFNTDVQSGSDESNLELLRVRIQSARNYNDLTEDLIAVIQTAKGVAIDSITIHGERGSTTLRFYSITIQAQADPGEKIAVVMPWYSDGHTENLNVDEFIQRELREIKPLWEVGACAPSRRSWFYEDPEQALAIYMQIVRTYLGRKANNALKGRQLALEDVFKHVFSDLFELEGKALPADPQDNFTSHRTVNLGNLAAAAVEARLGGASVKVRRRIAVDLHRNGETNIRRISKLTGLSRDTIYKELGSE
ncbi:hypothetical protein GCM10009555_017010 [Acrocarpospora macrocephala]|uniref:Uncharacterized protein n=1 Tax=Acrocarpospora macrocephala TaxID=150177 RepID=A0A5M3WJJ7_9ACTN|nr:hypothetical protein [Acrocarpospora macrocephala]GES07361.1 hypothetical protein Amac_009560 [Acrocarpospora macrocephala]